jgi:hypothetical protein
MEAFRKACAFLLSRTKAEPSSPATRLANDFLLLLSGSEGDPATSEARRHLEDLVGDPTWGELAGFLQKALQVIETEISCSQKRDENLAESFGLLGNTLLSLDGEREEPTDLMEIFWALFCPQAVAVRADWEERVRELREIRTVRDLSICPDPLQRPAQEVLFSSNVLLTVPPKGVQLPDLEMGEEIRAGVARAVTEDQAFWYDHPVQVGTEPEKNEILHGLKGLSDTLAFEKKRGTADPGDRLEVVLSASVTHPALHSVARAYIEEEVSREQGIRDLDLFVFTEDDTARLVEEFLCPAARQLGLEQATPDLFAGVFGVDGPYARHYNFLKAIAALWQVVRNPGIRATFKIDLDQVFPEDELVHTMDASAFELLCSPLWGARGRDAHDRSVSLGMIAGALVNEADIHRGLFTPDVTLPEGPWPPDRWVFASQVPQALSTVAEMMARYGGSTLDGKSRCLSRIHVTGGTIGIRIEGLRQHRPFTLSCIGRAEDQAYLLSVLGGPDEPLLRYAHVPGLIMRHDKHAFAGEAIRTAAAGKIVGDYERMLLFSQYAGALPWPLEETHASLDPFTGCFVLPLPFTTALLCLTLKALSLNGGRAGPGDIHPDELLRLGARRLGPLMAKQQEDPDWMVRAYHTERRAWHAYYDILDRVEEGVRTQSAAATQWIESARAVIEETRVAT